MKQLIINPSNKGFYSDDFIKGFECGTLRQFETDKKDERSIYMGDIYKFRRIEIRKEILNSITKLITDKNIAENVYMMIMNPLEDFLSDHEVKGD